MSPFFLVGPVVVLIRDGAEPVGATEISMGATNFQT